MQPLVCFEPVTAVPVTAAFNKAVRALDGLLDVQLLSEKEAYPNEREDYVDFRAQNACLFKKQLV